MSLASVSSPSCTRSSWLQQVFTDITTKAMVVFTFSYVPRVIVLILVASLGRAIAAPVIRRVFSSSQRDPRYHMLTHLSAKFSSAPAGHHEPRAALILNRFTRTLTILYATHALGDILNFPADEAVGGSFYECIQENCLQEAVDALERAKENDSIAYLRFQWRDPRQALAPEQGSVRQGRIGNRQSQGHRQVDGSQFAAVRNWVDRDDSIGYGPGGVDNHDGNNDADMTGDEEEQGDENGSYISGNSTSQSSMSQSPEPILEVEAVVSCTSDGLVVVLRKARPIIPAPHHPPLYHGVFASPWAHAPLVPPPPPQQIPVPGGPPAGDFMDSIRQVAVFAWSLRSINENLLQFAQNQGPADLASGFVGGPSTDLYRQRVDGEYHNQGIGGLDGQQSGGYHH